MLHDATTPATGRTQQRAARYMRIALRLVVTGIVLCGLLAAVSRIVQPKNNQAEFGQSDSEAHGVLGEPRDSIDVLVLGDSESFCSISPLQLWSEQGITSYVCGTSGQILPLTRSLLLSALSKQHPKVVILETNCLFPPVPTGVRAQPCPPRQVSGVRIPQPLEEATRGRPRLCAPDHLDARAQGLSHQEGHGCRRPFRLHGPYRRAGADATPERAVPAQHCENLP